MAKTQKRERVEATKEEIEMFFYSQWFTVLTKVNPNVIIKGIQEEIGQ